MVYNNDFINIFYMPFNLLIILYYKDTLSQKYKKYFGLSYS